MSEPIVSIEYSERFRKDVKRLYKKYRQVQFDINAFIDLLSAGDTPGDQIQGTGYTVYKARIKSSDLSKGKSGGYRIIYYLKTETNIILVTTYAKAEREDIDHQEIKRMIEAHELNRN